MSKRWLLLLPALLMLGGYLFVRYSLQKAIRKEEKKTTNLSSFPDTGNGKEIVKADLRPLFIKRLQQLLKHSSNNLYELSIDHLEVDLLASTVSLQHVMMRPNLQILEALKQKNQAPATIFTISFEKLIIQGINLDDAITSKTMDYKLVRIVNPVIRIDNNKSYKKPSKKEEDFSQRFLQEMQKLSVKRLIVEGGAIIISKDGGKVMQLNAAANLNYILLTDDTRNDLQRFLFAKEATLTFRNYSMQTKTGLYKLMVEKIIVKAPQQQMLLQNLSFASPLSKKVFVKRFKFNQEMFQLTLPSVSIDKVNWWALINKEEVDADEIVANGGTLAVYSDLSRPSRYRMGNFPNQILMKIPIKLAVKKFKVRNLKFSYEEYNPLSGQSGTVHLGRMALDVKNISNKSPLPVVASGTALLMDRVPIQAHFSFDMANYQQGNFQARFHSTIPFDGTLINSFSIPLGLLKIERGSLEELQATIKGNQWLTTGDILVLYKDLKLSLLEKQDSKLDKKNVTSLIANTFVLKKNNPKKGEEPRRALVELKRNPKAGFFAYAWKTLLAGVLKTIGAPTKLAK